MFIKRGRKWIVSMLFIFVVVGLATGSSGADQAGPTNNWVRHWNQVAIDASGIDHTPPASGEDRIFGEQYGPGRASRAMAIVHIAIFDAVNAIAGGYRSYTGLAPGSGEPATARAGRVLGSSYTVRPPVSRPIPSVASARPGEPPLRKGFQ